MDISTKEKKVGDMTMEDLREFVRKIIYETVDPDYGLRLRPEIEEELRESIKEKERGEGIPLEEVKKRLGLE